MKKMYRFPLKQNIGEAAVPAIVEGETVVRGQLIASKRDNSLSANIFTSVKGIVSEVGKDQITILADEEQSRDYMPLQSDTPLALVEEAGIVGLGARVFRLMRSWRNLFRRMER